MNLYKTSYRLWACPDCPACLMKFFICFIGVVKKVKNPGPEDQALVIPRGDLLY
jgi:hypothetical protein